jgi:hypothetical protein
MGAHSLFSGSMQMGECCCHDRGEGGLLRPLTTSFLTGGLGQIPTIEDYPYARIDFSRDPDMGVPPGVVRGELGMLVFQCYLIFMSFYIYHFFYTRVSDMYVSVMCRRGASVPNRLHED